MKSLRSLTPLAILLFALTLLSGTAFAWPACSGNWIQVPAGTSSANGAVVTENGQTFQCQKPAPTPTPTPTSVSNTNTNQQSQTQGQSQGQGQSQTANGGNAKSTATGGSVTGSGNSTVGINNTIGPVSSTSGVKNSGNSSNTNNNTANGGQGGQGGTGGTATSNQTQSNTSSNQNQSSASNQSNGNGSNSNNTTNNVEATKIPVATAFAPTAVPTSPCFKGFGAGVQTGVFGGSFGGGKIDANCRALQTALHAPNRVTFCKLFIKLQDSKSAGITMEDCLQVEETPVVEAPTPVTPVLTPATPAPLTVTVPVTIVNPAPAPEVKVIPSPVVLEKKVVKKHVARRLPPGCQNVVTLKCATGKDTIKEK